MATDKKHIAVYLDKENEKSLMEYIKQHGGIKYSAAVNQILSTFFGNSLSNLPVTDELEATITRIVEEQLSKLPSITPSNLPSYEVLERLSSLEKKLEDLSSIPEVIPGNLLNQSVVEPDLLPSNIPETIPGSVLGQEVVEPEQILSNIPGIRPSEVGTVSLGDAIASPDSDDKPYKVAVEVDANAPVADPKFNSLELKSALEPDSETDPSFSEAAQPSLPVSEPAPNTETELLSGVQVCKLLKLKDYQLSKMSSDEIKAKGFKRVKVGRRSKYRKLL
ncbi:MAG: hypothetical protein WBB28_09290 [Crinalium sp.]